MSTKPGDTVNFDGYEFVAHTSQAKGTCQGCHASLFDALCDAMPETCGPSDIIWRTSPDEYKALQVLIKLGVME